MQVAVLSDIHGNRTAFEAVLTALPATVDECWCLGDLVGYNPWPNACVTRVREHVDATVQGNHDRRVAQYHDASAKESTSVHQSTAWTAEQVYEQNVQFLADLPEKQTLHEDRVELSHSDPRHGDGYIFPDEAQNLDRYLRARPRLDLLAMGHTHIPFVEQVEGTVVMNPGSVGQPRDGDPRASYAIVELSSDIEPAAIEIHRVPYDTETVVERIEAVALPDRFGDRLW